ncbi:MAG TPA: glycosyltransferase family 39 protein, partial [Polyangiales bacterium]|nr:glycosyltransferase family 39 protein [Polyangiales bacterium]
MLALAELMHVRELIGPLVAALCVPLTFALGRRWFGAGRAQLGAALLVLSPHFVGTAGTLLSQPTSCLMLLLGLWLLVRAEESGGVLALLAALAFGFGVLVRPLPGGLFALVAVAWALFAAARAERAERGPAIARAAWLTLGAALGGCAVLAVNYVQTGDALTSGYHQAHGSVRVFENKHADLASSLFGALLRENIWLLGVPGCLIPVLFARPQRMAALYWGMLAAELSYRLISPKTVVASTGPVYLTEVVPLLLLGVVDGLGRARERVRFDGAALRSAAPQLTAAALAVACCMFWPVQWRTLRRSVDARTMLPRALESAGAQRALVFADALVYPASQHSWAYFPDNPSPDLSDDVLYVRVPKRDIARNARELWQRRFADRRAFLLSWNARGEPV